MDRRDRRYTKPPRKDQPPKKKRVPRLCPVEASVRDNNLEQAMRVLKNKMSKENVLGELRKRRYFEKPSEKKRRKKREALRKAQPTKKKKWVKRSRVVASIPIKKTEE